jgi:RNA polymerase sigma-70 factor (ECF subfamily)
MEHAHTLQLYGTAGVRYNVEAMTRSDVQLMLDVKAGDEASFNLLLQKYRTPLVNFLYRMVRNRGTAEDLAQEVFLRVYRARKQYSPSAKFTTWLFRIATNLALNSLRDNRYRQMDVSIDTPVEEDVAPLQLPSRELRVDEKMIERDRSEFIRRAIATLPEKQRVAVLLHKYEEMDYGEIAKILECSESALKSLLFRAYETLRVQLAPLVSESVAGRIRRSGTRWKNTWPRAPPATSARKISASCGACWTKCRWSSRRSVSMRGFARGLQKSRGAGGSVGWCRSPGWHLR